MQKELETMMQSDHLSVMSVFLDQTRPVSYLNSR